jgi:spermidine synthase
MNDAAGAAPPLLGRTARLALLALLFFASGAAGLVYQVAWSRRLELTFGSTTYSIGTVLAAYMAGLGLGAWAFGKLADRAGSPTRRYAALEAGIGVYGLLAPSVLDLVDAAWIASGGQGGALVKTVLGLLALLPPTFLMGGTLPVLVRGLIEQRADAQRATGLLYGANTLGAVMGATVAGLVLVPAIGMDAASWGTGVFNLALAALALAVGPRLVADVRAAAAPSTDAPAPVVALDPAARLRLTIALATTAGCGAVALALEVAWSRAFGLALGSTGHGFTIVLAGTLLGIGAGSLAVARRGGDADRPLAWLAAALLTLSAACYGFLLGYERLLHLVFDLAQARTLSYEGFLFVQLLVCAGMLLPATLALGVAFPLAVELGTPQVDASGRTLGRLYFANTLGSITGALGGAFVLVPLLGAEGMIRAGVGVAALGGVALVLAAHRRGVWVPPRSTSVGLLAGALVLASLAAPRWDPLLLDSAPTRPRRGGNDLSPGEVWEHMHRKGGVLRFAREGLNGYVSVRSLGEERVLLLGGKPDASTFADMPTQLMSGVAPMLARPDARRALVVGIGSGATVRAIADFPGVERVDVVEIEQAVVDAAREHFRGVNEGVLDRPTTRVLLEDARTVLLTAPEASYDVIAAVPTNPWIAGVANLFTLEHYQNARRALRPGGVYMQWVQLYLTDEWMSRSMLRTYLEAFPHVEVWCGMASDLLLVGSDRPIVHDLPAARAALLGNPGVARDLWARLYARSPDELFSRFVASGDELRPLVAAGEVLRDRSPRLEGRAARANYEFNTPSLLGELWAVAARRASPWPALTGPPPEGVDLRVAAARHLSTDADAYASARALLEGSTSPEAAALRGRLGLEDPRTAAAALIDLEAALAAHPRDPHLLLAVAWARQREPARLLPLLATLEAIGERSARIHLLRTATLDPDREEQAGQVVVEVERGLAALLPRHEERSVRRLLLSQLVECGRTAPGARALLERLCEADGDDTDAFVTLARVALRAGDAERCLEVLDRLADRHAMENSRVVRVERVLALAALGDEDRLRGELATLLRLFPDEAEHPQVKSIRFALR